MPPIFSLKRYNVFEAATETLPEIALNEKFVLQPLTLDDLKSASMAHQKNRLEKFKGRIKNGHICYGHRDTEAKKIASYFWVTTSQKGQAPFTLGLDVFFPQGYFYIWDCRVDTAYQRQKLYTSGLAELKNQYKSQKALIVSETKNQKSTKGILKAGHTKIGVLHFIQLLGFNIIRGHNTLSSDIITFQKPS